jgi:hypothetical protein
LCYSPDVDELLSDWKRITLVGDEVLNMSESAAVPLNYYPPEDVQETLEQVTVMSSRESSKPVDNFERRPESLLDSVLKEPPAKKKKFNPKRRSS